MGKKNRSETTLSTIKIKYIPTKIQGIIFELHPEWTNQDSISKEDISFYQKKYLERVLIHRDIITQKTGDEIVESLMSDEFKPVVKPIAEDKNLTIGEKVADKIAEFGGSWKFISIFGFVLFVWIVINSIAIFGRNFDPYPFILLNLILSCLAAIQAPIIMMSQNRHEDRDRKRGENDYITNLKSEVGIRLLNEKIDCILNEQIPELLTINSSQFELIKEQQMAINHLLAKQKRDTK